MSAPLHPATQAECDHADAQEQLAQKIWSSFEKTLKARCGGGYSTLTEAEARRGWCDFALAFTKAGADAHFDRLWWEFTHPGGPTYDEYRNQVAVDEAETTRQILRDKFEALVAEARKEHWLAPGHRDWLRAVQRWQILTSHLPQDEAAIAFDGWSEAAHAEQARLAAEQSDADASLVELREQWRQAELDLTSV